MKIPFSKMTGSGNDFIVVDNMDLRLHIEEIKPYIPKFCARGISEGADGFIMIEPDKEVDFKWHFYNADGSLPEMCGNGARCAARFAYLKGHAAKKMAFHTVAGIIRAEIREGVNVKVQLTPSFGLVLDKAVPLTDKVFSYSFVNTGVPHAVLLDEDMEQTDVNAEGRRIRNHPEFAPGGTNVNFIKVLNRHTVKVRTYERGVEGETLACGTGAVASALIALEKGLAESPVLIKPSGGIDMTVYREEGEIYLEGEARLLAEGTLLPESMDY